VLRFHQTWSSKIDDFFMASSAWATFSTGSSTFLPTPRGGPPAEGISLEIPKDRKRLQCAPLARKPFFSFPEVFPSAFCFFFFAEHSRRSLYRSRTGFFPWAFLSLDFLMRVLLMAP